MLSYENLKRNEQTFADISFTVGHDTLKTPDGLAEGNFHQHKQFTGSINRRKIINN